MKFNQIKYLFLVLLFLSSWMTYSQEEEIEEELFEEFDSVESSEKQLIGLTELMSLMKTDEERLTISNYEVIFKEEDKNLMLNKFFFKLFELTPAETFYKEFILFHNCTFNLKQKEYLVFKSWMVKRIEIVGCEFNGRISLDNFSYADNNSIFIENCIFNDELKISNDFSETSQLKLKNNDFYSELIIGLKLKDLIIDTCRFIASNDRYKKDAEVKTSYQLILNEYPIENVVLTKNTFNNNGINNLFSIDFSSQTFDELRMISNSMQTINLTAAEVSKTLLIDSLYVSDYIGILNFDFPERNSNIPWYNLAGEKFSVFQTVENIEIPYNAKSNEELANNLLYNDLISAYNKFNTLYHDRGDINSANQSYIEIKDIETRKQAYTQLVSPSLNNFINYRLNKFLKTFSDYATNPGKSLIQSIWVILIFTGLYMITFSRWDGMNYEYYLKQFRLFSEYITTKKDIKDIYLKKENPLEKDIKELRERLLLKGEDLPRILKLLGEPLHFLGKFRNDIIPGLIRTVNFQPNSWKSLKTKPKKLKAAVLITIISLGFFIYVFVVKFINSLVLSLNSFVVIGFGALPEEDEIIPMYLSIIEGIIGWFLLAIFTITLLSQVLQGA